MNKILANSLSQYITDMVNHLVLNKNYLFAVVLIIIAALCYELAFKKTVAAYQLNRHLNSQLNNSGLTAQPQFNARQNSALSKTLQIFKADTANFRNEVTDKIAQIADKGGCTVTDVPVQSPNSFSKAMIQRVKITGEFKKLLTILYHIEGQRNIGYVRSVSFKKNITPGSVANTTITTEIFTEIVK